MRKAALLLLTAVVAAAPETERALVAARKARRVRVAEEIGEGYALVIGQPPTEVLHPGQHGHFLYLTGVDEPSGVLLLRGAKAKATPAAEGRREMLFLPKHGERHRQFTGHRLAPDKATADLLGIEVVLPAPRRAQGLARELAKLLPHKAVLWIPAYRGPDDAFVREIRRDTLESLQALRSDISVQDLHPVLARMRSIKDPLELGALRRACTLTVEAFHQCLPAIRPGGSEAEVDGVLLAAVRARGARPAYPFVVGAGANAAIPHYFRNADALRAGELLLIDAGGAVDRYAADVTRTFPISGKFTARQREIYEIVLRAQRAGLDAVRVGATFREIDAAARQVIKDAGLGKHFIHGTCHHVGLDVHDPGPTRIQAGMTFTVEPGVYLPDERIGIRIEDVVLVTDKGVENLTAAFPKDPDEIERLLAASRKK